MSIIAFVTSTVNGVGADAGISITSYDPDGDVHTEIMTAEGTELDDADGGLAFNAAEAALRRMGYRLTGPWTESGGQWAVKVEAT